jgi:hypothetical protein
MQGTVHKNGYDSREKWDFRDCGDKIVKLVIAE